MQPHTCSLVGDVPAQSSGIYRPLTQNRHRPSDSMIHVSVFCFSLSRIQRFVRSWVQEIGSDSLDQRPTGPRAAGLIRDARCHVAPEYGRRFRRRRRRNQTVNGHLQVFQLQRQLGGQLQSGPPRAQQSLQERLGELGRVGRARLGPQLHHAAGQRRAQVRRCSPAAERRFQLQR